MRSRITITISNDLLSSLDETIDNHTIRNRSQAIETALRQVLTPTVNTAVVLAGGSLSEHPVTKKAVPKALIPIQDVPVIMHILHHLQRYNFKRVIICTNKPSYKLISQEVAADKNLDLDIEYSIEPKRLGTGGALKHASEKLGQQPFLLIHGDVLTDINLDELIQFYNSNNQKSVIAIKPRPGRLSYGRVFLEGNTVIDFQEPKETSPVSLVNTGIYIFDPSVLQLMPKDEVFSIEEQVIPKLVKAGQAIGSVFQGIWFDVSESESYQEANERWPEHQ